MQRSGNHEGVHRDERRVCVSGAEATQDQGKINLERYVRARAWSPDVLGQSSDISEMLALL